MANEKPCCAAAATRILKKLTLPDGSQVAILNLESILKEVDELELADNKAVKKELLKRVKIYNYVAPSADNDYSKALIKAYERQYGNPNREVN